MPRSTLSLARVRELLPESLGSDALVELLFRSKAEVESRHDDELTVSVTPDRLDLLSEGGLALYLQGAAGASAGPVRLRRGRSGTRAWSIDRDPSVVPVRPYIAAVVLRAPTGKALDEATLGEAVRFQELLHATLGRDRRAMSLGIYPARRLVPPIRYALEPAAAVSFVPLHTSSEVAAASFLATDPMASRYGALGRTEAGLLTLRDAEGKVLSLPPILNSANAGEAKTGDRILLVESTGTRARAVREGLGLLLVVFAARGWSVEAVPVRDGEHPLADAPAPLAPSSVVLGAETLRALTGQTWTPREVADRLASARLAARRVRGGWSVMPPPWRPDLLTGVDVAEDVLLARELTAADGVVPPSPTRGRHRRETLFRRKFSRLLLGLGFQQPHTPILVAAATVAAVGGPTPLQLANPVSQEFAYLRNRIFLSHLGVLERNVRHGYPQRFAEVGPVVVADPAAEAGGATRYHAAVLLAGERCGFADAASTVDALLRVFDVGSVREPTELPGSIPGRSARVRVAGEPVAELGEVEPRLLTALGVPVPAAWAEVDLSALWPLAGGRDTD